MQMLRISGAIALLSIYAFVEWMGTTLEHLNTVHCLRLAEHTCIQQTVHSVQYIRLY